MFPNTTVFGNIDRPIVDKTGLDGVYHFVLQLTGDDYVKAAVEDIFGLKFESHRRPSMFSASTT